MLSLFIGGTTIKADSHGETVTNITVAQYQQNIAKTIPVTPTQVVNKLHAGDTFVLLHLKLQKGNAVKPCVKRTQGANPFAEGAIEQYA